MKTIFAVISILFLFGIGMFACNRMVVVVSLREIAGLSLLGLAIIWCLYNFVFKKDGKSKQ